MTQMPTTKRYPESKEYRSLSFPSTKLLKDHKAFLANIPWSFFWAPRTNILLWFWEHTQAVGWVWPMMFTGGALLFTDFRGQTILEWRSFNQYSPVMNWFVARFGWSDYSNHHFLNLAAEAWICFALAWWLWKQEGRSFFRWGRVASYGAFQVWAYHEGMWWIVYIIAAPLIYGQHLEAKWFTGLGEILVFSLIVFTFVMGLYWPKKFLLSMALFYLLWFAVGFPITESYLGNTQWYNTFWGDGWEVGSWFWAVGTYYVFERKGLLNWFRRVRAIALDPPVKSI